MQRGDFATKFACYRKMRLDFFVNFEPCNVSFSAVKLSERLMLKGSLFKSPQDHEV